MPKKQHVRNFFRRLKYLIKGTSGVTLKDCKDLGLEPTSFSFYPSVFEDDIIIFNLCGKKVEFSFNFDFLVREQLTKNGKKEGEDGAPYFDSTVKELFPDFHKTWEMYNDSVEHIK